MRFKLKFITLLVSFLASIPLALAAPLDIFKSIVKLEFLKDIGLLTKAVDPIIGFTFILVFLLLFALLHMLLKSFVPGRIGIILALITIALFYIAYKKNWSYWWIKMIKIILIIATIILLGFGWFSYNIVYI